MTPKIAAITTSVCVALGFFWLFKPARGPDLAIGAGSYFERASSTWVEDLGLVLTSEHDFVHTFRVSNLSNRQIRLRNPRAFRPCCSSIVIPPMTVPPGRSVEIPVAVKAQGRSGPSRFEFSVATDSRRSPLLRLALVAHLLPEVSLEDEPAGDSDAGAKSFLIVRRSPSGGAAPPASIEGTAGLRLSLAEEAIEREGQSGSRETVQRLIVQFPETAAPGRHSGEVKVIWSDGRIAARPVSWEVEPALTARPSALVLKGSQNRFQILLRSREAPFHVLGVQGPHTTGHQVVSGAGSKAQILEITVDPARPHTQSSVAVRTDHPSMTQVVLSVVTLP